VWTITPARLEGWSDTFFGEDKTVPKSCTIAEG